MSVLDELRDIIIGYRPSAMFTDPSSEDVKEVVDDIVAAIDAFEAAHPGLVELLCCFCGGPVTDKSKVRASRFVCDACAKESSDEV